MDDDWKYGTVLRRAITANPVQYSRVMYIGPGKLSPSGRRSIAHFIGIQLTESPPPAVGKWVNPVPVGLIRPSLRRSLFEKDPDAD